MSSIDVDHSLLKIMSLNSLPSLLQVLWNPRDITWVRDELFIFSSSTDFFRTVTSALMSDPDFDRAKESSRDFFSFSSDLSFDSLNWSYYSSSFIFTSVAFSITAFSNMSERKFFKCTFFYWFSCLWSLNKSTSVFLMLLLFILWKLATVFFG